MNGPYAKVKRNGIPKSHDTPKAANRKAPIPESRDTPETANKNLQKKAPIRHNRSIEKHGHVLVKKDKDHKYLLSKGPVSLLEDEPEVERAVNNEKVPETKLSEDVGQADESSEKKERKKGETQKGRHWLYTNIHGYVISLVTVTREKKLKMLIK